MIAAKIAITTALLCSAILPPKSSNSPVNFSESAKQEMVDLVNQMRSKGCQCGRKYMPPVGPIRWNTKLEKAAQNHAMDMQRNNFFAHKGSNGSSIGDRANKAGYRWYAVGENISWNYDSFQETLAGWKASPGHCRNLMSNGFNEMGAAKVGAYWVQDFGASYDKY